MTLRFVHELGKFNHRFDIKLFHYTVAVPFYGTFIDTQLRGDLLVQPSLQHMRQNIGFTWRQLCEALCEVILSSAYLVLIKVSRQSALYGSE